MNLVFTIDIRAPVDQVFCWITRRDKIEQWLPLVDNQMTRETSDRVGTMLRQVYQSGRRRVELTVEVLKYVANRQLVFRIATRKQDTQFDYRIEPRGEGTRLTAAVEIRLLGFMKLLGFLIGEKILDRALRDCREDFARLKRLCEQECAARAPHDEPDC